MNVLRKSTVAALALAICFTLATLASAATGTDPAKELAKLTGAVLTKGPYNEKPISASTLTFTKAELAKIKAKKGKAAIVMHYGGNDWSTAQIKGMRAEFSRLGIKVVAVTDANFKPDKQVSDIETVLQLKPNVIVSIPTDPVATAAAYKQAAAKGVKLVFLGLIGKGLKPGRDYLAMSGADDYGNGVASAHLLAAALKKKNGSPKGDVAMVYHEAVFAPTNNRYTAFKATMKKYPNIKIVEEKGIGGPDFAGDASAAATALLTKHSDLDAIWAVWDVPAEGVMAAARAAGRDDLIITTIDLGLNVAVEMAKGGLIKGVGAQRPYDMGVAQARLGAYALIGKKAPPFVAVSALPTNQANVLKAWQQIYHTAPPKALKDAVG